MNITFIGLGIMGREMVTNLIKNEIPLTIYNRTLETAAPFANKGARIAGSLAEAVAEAEASRSAKGQTGKEGRCDRCESHRCADDDPGGSFRAEAARDVLIGCRSCNLCDDHSEACLGPPNPPEVEQSEERSVENGGCAVEYRGW